VSNRWAPKSAKDEADEPAVDGARRLHLVLFVAFAALGVLAGFMLFQGLDQNLPVAILEELVDDEFSAGDVLLCGFYMAVLGLAGAELGNAIWLLLCRHRLGLSADQVRAALAGGPGYSLVLRYLFRL
jgi:hypothetical protein